MPMPFLETEVPPDNVSDTYTNTPNKIRFVKIFNRAKTDCNNLFLNKKIVTIDSMADIKKNIGIIFCNIEKEENKSIEKTGSFAILHKLNTKVSPPEIIPAIKRYRD